MARTETDHLVSMANDIADNLGFQADADARVAEHIERFWAPRMRRLLIEYAANDGRGLSELLLKAVEKLQ